MVPDGESHPPSAKGHFVSASLGTVKSPLLSVSRQPASGIFGLREGGRSDKVESIYYII